MKILLGICFLTATLLCTDTAEEKCYNNWERFKDNLEAKCMGCKKDDNAATADCFRKAWYPLDSNENLMKEVFLAYQLDKDHYTGSAETKEIITKALRECMKDGAKTPAELKTVDKCVMGVFLTNCKDAEPWINKIRSSENLKICMF